MLEQTSQPDSQVPIRRYNLSDRHRTIRLTFRTGGQQYWGIQETAWPDAPVLNERNFRRIIKGREYDLYYNGSELKMVVLHTRTGTYWVMNTLLNSISNETMLAIAQGLKPLGRAR
jgi:hypothetical protein